MKKLYYYFKLWVRDELADLLDTKPLIIQNRFDNFYHLVKYFAGAWPIIGAGWLSFSINEIKAGNRLFINSLSEPSKYSVDYAVLAFDMLSLVWLVLFLATIVIEDSRLKRSLSKLRSSIIKAPSKEIYQDARSLLDMAYKVNNALQPYKAEFESQNYSNIESLVVAIKSINSLILEISRDFFESEFINGANIMVYLEKDETPPKVIQAVSDSSTKLYFRCEEEKNLKGLLYMSPELFVDNSVPDQLVTPIILPIYKTYITNYKNPNPDEIELIIPGAMLAFKRGTSMVGDTLDKGKYYKDFDERTQKEIMDYFKPNDLKIRSFSSFRIPNDLNDEDSCIGVLNLNSNFSYSFGEDEEFFVNFYTLIYPVLKILSGQLSYYIKYINHTYK